MMKILLVPFLLHVSIVSAQVKSAADTSGTAAVKTPGTNNKASESYLTATISYGNTANYYGQTTAERLPYMSADVTYNHKSGAWVSVAPYKLLDYAGISEFDLSAGYDYKINKQAKTGASYMRSFYPQNSPLLQSAYVNSLSAYFRYDWQIFKTTLNALSAFGGQHDTFLSFKIARYSELGSLFSKQDYISFEPAAKVSGGTQRFYTTYQEKQVKQGKGSAKGKSTKKNASPKEEIVSTTAEQTKFTVLSYNLVLPLAYNRTHYSLEGSCQLTKPGNKSALFGNNIQSFFSLSFYYLFF